MPTSKNYYKILQIDPSAEQEVVEAAYKRLARKYHPDTNKSSNATQHMQEINEAYEVLKDKVKRAKYDQEQGFNATGSDNDEQRRKEQADAEKRRAQEKERVKKEKESSEQYRKEQSEAEQKRNLNNLQKESRQQKQILVAMLGLLLFLSVIIVISIASYIFGLPKFFPNQSSGSTQITSITQIVPVTKIDFSTIEVTQIISVTQIAPATIEVTQIIPSTQVIQVTQVVPITQIARVTKVIPITQVIVPATTQAPIFSNTPPVFIYPVDGQTLDYEGSYLFKITPVKGANGYLWGFFQNDVMVWENFRDEGELSGVEYGIDENSFAHSKFEKGYAEVWVRASINGEWTEPTVITIYLKPR